MAGVEPDPAPKRTPNPKKVAAGRASAAARKAKEAKFLEELSQAKAAIPSEAPKEIVEVEKEPAKAEKEPAKAPQENRSGYTTWALVIGGSVCALWLYSRMVQAEPQRKPRPEISVVLKPDPFHMD